MKDQVKKNEVAEEALDEASIGAATLHPNTKPAGEDPKSKIEYIAKMIGAMHAMEKKDLEKWYHDTISQFGPNKMPGAVDKSSQNQSSIDMHASDASSSTGPKTSYPMPKLSVKEDVEEMFAGSNLSEEFKERASTLFEAAVTSRIIVETARLEEEFETKIEENIAEINEELTSKIDSYLDYVVEQWMEENAVAIESTLRNEVMEEFIDGMKKLFTEHYIDVPQEKINVIETLASKVEELEAKLDEQIIENTEIKRSLVDVEKNNVFELFSDNLTLSQKEKFAALSEGIDFDGDLEVYAKKLEIIKEAYFSTEKGISSSTNIEEETFEGEITENTVMIDPSVNRYVQAISRTLKK